MLTAASLPRFEPPRRVVLMGVTGCGKSTVGASLAPQLGAEFLDGDDLHPAQNIAKMRRGEALTDADRAPWLELIGAALRPPSRRIIGCSALRRHYRDQITLAAQAPVFFILLAASPAVIKARLQARKGHFMPASLIASQFATLEPPAPDEYAMIVDSDQACDSVVAAILTQLAALSVASPGTGRP